MIADWTCAGCGKTQRGSGEIVRPKEKARQFPPRKWLRLSETEFCCSQTCFRIAFQNRERLGKT